MYGPVPILSFKYMSRAMRQAGYEATTVVHDLYAIHARDDFDVVTDRGDVSWPDPPLSARALRRLGPSPLHRRSFAPCSQLTLF